MQRGCPNVWNMVHPQETTTSKMATLGEFLLFQQGNEDGAQIFDSEREREKSSFHT